MFVAGVCGLFRRFYVTFGVLLICERYARLSNDSTVRQRGDPLASDGSRGT